MCHGRFLRALCFGMLFSCSSLPSEAPQAFLEARDSIRRARADGIRESLPATAERIDAFYADGVRLLELV